MSKVSGGTQSLFAMKELGGWPRFGAGFSSALHTPPMCGYGVRSVRFSQVGGFMYLYHVSLVQDTLPINLGMLT